MFNTFGIVTSAPTTTETTFTLTCHNLQSSLAKSWYFCTSCLSKTTTSGRLCSITWSVWMLKSQRILIWSVSSTFSGTWSYHFDCTLTLLTQIPMDHLGELVVSAFVLRLSMHSALAGNVRYSLLRRIAHSAHRRDISFLNFWSCAAIIRPSVSFLSSPLLNHSQVLLLATCSVHLRNRPRSVLSSLLWFLYSVRPNSSAFMYFCATNIFSWVLY